MNNSRTCQQLSPHDTPYFLIAKNQGTDYTKNNKYILVYSATILNDNGKLELTELYYPVPNLALSTYEITESLNGFD